MCFAIPGCSWLLLGDLGASGGKFWIDFGSFGGAFWVDLGSIWVDLLEFYDLFWRSRFDAK